MKIRKKAQKREMSEVLAIKDWFEKAVTHEGEPYVLDLEQVEAVVDESKNTIVVARAGSGKTRTLVAKIIYLVAKRGVKPEEIMAFVFNANAAAEINARLSEMLVEGRSVIPEGAKIAQTFHAFSRRVVMNLAGGKEKCGDILAGEKEAFVYEVVRLMRKNPVWEAKIRGFVSGEEEKITEVEVLKFAGMMAQFINRAQQQFLGAGQGLREKVEEYLEGRNGIDKRNRGGTETEISERERLFLELGVECYRRYHWHLLGGNANTNRDSLKGSRNAGGGKNVKIAKFKDFGTDFNLIVAWAAKIIRSNRGEVRKLLENKKFLLIDEYQDFSGLFLNAVKAIREVATEVKLFVVGDDWQAINRFAGSDVDFFKNFEQYFSEGTRRLEISTNYRCNYQIVNTARKFMAKAMGEKGHFKAFSKQAGEVILVNPANTALGFSLVDHDTRVSDEDRIYKKMTARMQSKLPKKTGVQYIKTLLEVIEENRSAKEILLLHRSNEMNLQEISLEGLVKGLKWGAKQLGLGVAQDFESRVSAMTMHKSKGLEAEVVILLEADEGVIPRVHPDTSLYEFFGETTDVVLEDQKRLFYVAMTRAKRRLYIMHLPAKSKKEDGFVRFLGRGVERWREE